MRGHPHVASLVTVTHGPLAIHMHMEYAGKHNLLVWLRKRGEALTKEEVVAVARQCTEALCHLHSLSVAHRDVKPENVVVGDPKPEAGVHATLVDMGLAVIATGKCESTAPCGTVPFLAPEVLEGLPYSAFPADAWSLGALFLELNYGTFTVDALTGLTTKTCREADVDPCKLALLESPPPGNCSFEWDSGGAAATSSTATTRAPRPPGAVGGTAGHSKTCHPPGPPWRYLWARSRVLSQRLRATWAVVPRGLGHQPAPTHTGRFWTWSHVPESRAPPLPFPHTVSP